MMKQRVDSDKDNDKDPNGEDNDDLIFDTTTNLWSDAFLAGRGGDFGFLTTMTTATTMAGERVDSDEDNDKDPNGEVQR